MTENVQELWELINSVNVMDYASANGYTVVKKGKTNVLKEHDSCVFFSPTSFHRFSTSRGGGLYQFIQEFIEPNPSKAFQLAKEVVGSHIYAAYSDPKRAVERDYNHGGIIIPPKNKNANKAIKYLCEERKLPYNIVKNYLYRKILYQDIMGNCVFVGRYENRVYYAMKRSTYIEKDKQPFKGDVAGSYKEVGVYYSNRSSTLIITESVIDQMSYQALHSDNSKSFNYLSTNGVSSVEKALKFHLSKRGNVKHIIFALDNDAPGRDSTGKAIEMISHLFPTIVCSRDVPVCKDWNEDLCQNKKKIMDKNKTGSVTDPVKERIAMKHQNISAKTDIGSITKEFLKKGLLQPEITMSILVNTWIEDKTSIPYGVYFEIKNNEILITDNRSCDCWVESFPVKDWEYALAWGNGEIEMDVYLEMKQRQKSNKCCLTTLDNHQEKVADQERVALLDMSKKDREILK